ncbi:MAG: hypothetical protein KDA60_02445, partial [Planctomycetales bacterium]|nr:hypothetical protein [Planctomycetales bacterium]
SGFKEERRAYDSQRKRLARRLRQRRTQLNVRQLLHGGHEEELESQIKSLQVEIASLQEERETAKNEYEAIATDHEDEVSLRRRLQAELNSTMGSLVEQRNEDKELREQLARTRELLNERAQQVTELRHEVDSLVRKQAENSDATDAEQVEELMSLRHERDTLQDELSALRAVHAEQAAAAADNSEMQDLQRRFEMLVEKVRDLKNRNAELETELDSWRSNPELAEADGDAEYQARLAALRNVQAGGPAVADQLPAAGKDARDITEDRGDGDHLAEERAELRRLQDEWHEKLRAAEVEISIERAENGRVRSQLQEKLRDLEVQIKQLEGGGGVVEGKGGKPRRKWMERLGLNNDDE